MPISRKPSTKSVASANSKGSFRRSPQGSTHDYHLVPIEDQSGNDATSASEAETSFSGSSINTTINDNKSPYKIQNLSAIELKAFESVKTGDLEVLEGILNSSEYFDQGDINNTDKCGFTLLHYAVIHQYEHIVDFLFSRENIFVYDTLFYAILEENVVIVKKIIKFAKANSDRLEKTPTRDSDFPKSTTPLMLACKIGCFDLIELFYKGGDRLSWCQEGLARTSMYHDECFCNMCLGPKGLEQDYERLSLWQAFCNPVYITFISGEKKDFDPIQEAFFLIKLLKERVLPIEPVFTHEYTELVTNLEEYTVDILGMCRNSYETELMLMAPRDNKECAEKYPRLRWALDLNNTNFVVHAHTQSVLYKWWAGDGWPAWIGMHPILKFLHFLSRFILFLPVSILLLFDRESSLGRFFSTPVNIFLNSMASYSVFLIILVVQIVYPYQRCNTAGNYKIDAECNSKGPPRIGTEWLIFIYVLGFMLNSIKHFWPMKKGFFKYKWNIWNLSAQLSFMVAFIFWGLSYLEWTNNLSVTNGVDPEIPRHLWKSTDPILIAEAFFALATMLSVGKILQFVQVDPSLGPLQTGLGRVIHKFFTTGIYFSFVLFAFAAGLSGNYKGYFNIKDENGVQVETKVQDDFADFFGTTKNLYFGLYGLINRDALVIELDDIELANGTKVPQHHYINQATGKCMSVAFHIFAVIMMMSVLVAFLFNAFGEAQDGELTTWKYTRTEVYLHFGLETAIPSPVNLLTFLNMYYYSRCNKKTAIASGCSSRLCCYYHERETKQDAKKRRSQYFILMNKFRLQYIELVQTKKDEELATADDVIEIYEELEQFKALMQEKGWKTPEKSGMDEYGKPGSNSTLGPPVSASSPKPSPSAAARMSPQAPSITPIKSTPSTSAAANMSSITPTKTPKTAAPSKSATAASMTPTLAKFFTPSTQTPSTSQAMEMKPIVAPPKTGTPSKAPVLPSRIGSPSASASKQPTPAPATPSVASKVEPSIVDLVPPTLPPKGSSVDVSSQPSKASATLPTQTPPTPSKAESKSEKDPASPSK